MICSFWWTSSPRTGESWTCIVVQSKTTIELIKLKLCYFLFKRAIVLLYKTLIRRLESFKALWTVCSLYWTFWFTLKCIIWRKMLECFHHKPQFLFDWRKKDMDILDDTGVSTLKGFSKVNYSFKTKANVKPLKWNHSMWTYLLTGNDKLFQRYNSIFVFVHFLYRREIIYLSCSVIFAVKIKHRNG